MYSIDPWSMPMAGNGSSATFRGDDLAFRLRFREATNKGRTVIVLTPRCGN